MLTSSFFWQARVAGRTKLSYFSGFMYYLSNPLILVFPIQNFVLLYHPTHTSFPVGLLFLPSMIFTTLVMWRHVYGDFRYGTILAYMTALWSYTYAILSFGSKEGWTPTGEQQQLSVGFRRMALLSTTYFTVYSFVVGYTLMSGKLNLFDWHYSLTVFWILVNFFFQGVFMHGLWSYLWAKRTEEAIAPGTEPVLAEVTIS